MTFKDAFPKFYQQTHLPEDLLWEKPFYYVSASLEKVMPIFKANIRACENNTDEELRIATAICTDLLAFPERPISTRLLADFLKFQVCTLMMNILAFKRLNHPLFHWIANSVSSSIEEDQSREVSGERVKTLSKSDLPYIKNNFRFEFIKWTRQLFYYMRVMGGHQQLTAYYLDHLLNDLFGLANRAYYYPELDIGLGQIVTWASNTGHDAIAERAAKIKMYLYDSQGYPEEWRKNIEFGFACTGYEYTNKSQLEWIDLVFDKRSLSGHERMQLLAQKYKGDAATVKDHLSEIFSSIDEYHDYLRTTYKKGELLNYELSRIYSLLTPVLLALLQEGEVEVANQLVGHYFSISGSALIEPHNAVITQGTLKGVQYSRQDKVLWSGETPHDHAGDLMKTANSFFGWTGVMMDDISFMPEEPLRGSGVPNPASGPQLESIIVKFYGFDQPAILTNLSEASGYYLFAHYQLPLQPLMVKYGHFAIPMIQSFKKILPPRDIKNAFIWQGDSNSSELECDAIQLIFESKGINVFRLNWHQSSKEEFLEAYYRQDFDLVWVSGHGEFDQFKPHLSSLVLYQEISEAGRSNVTVGYDEIKPYEDNNSSRRLLVLNICDGATTTLDNSPVAIGLGAKMINESQSLISHQWPIEPFAGLITGFLLANALAEGKNYMDSYRYVVELFLEGKESIVNLVRDKLPGNDLADTIDRNTAVDFQNIFFFGSLMYAE